MNAWVQVLGSVGRQHHPPLEKEKKMPRIASSKSLAITSMSLFLGTGIALADTNWDWSLVEAHAAWGVSTRHFSDQIPQGQPGAFEHPTPNDDQFTWNPAAGTTQFSKTNYYAFRETNLGMKVYYDTAAPGGENPDSRSVLWSYSGSYTMSEAGTFSMAVNGYDFKRSLAAADLDILEISMEASHQGVTKSSGQLIWEHGDAMPTGYSSLISFENLAVSAELDWQITMSVEGSNNRLGQGGDSLLGVMLGQSFMDSNAIVPGPLGAVSLAFVGLARRRRRRSVRG